MGKRDFVTCDMLNVKHSVTHRPQMGELQRKQRKKPANWARLTMLSRYEVEVPPCKCGDSYAADKWINGHHAMGTKYRNTNGGIQKTLRSRWKKGVAYPVGKTEDAVKHVF